MNILLCVTVSVAGIYGFFMLICVLRSFLGQRALERNGCVTGEDETRIRVRVQALEYCIRAAIAERNLVSKKIIVEIDSGSPTLDEEKYIAEALREKYGNMEIRFI